MHFKHFLLCEKYNCCIILLKNFNNSTSRFHADKSDFSKCKIVCNKRCIYYSYECRGKMCPALSYNGINTTMIKK